LVFALATFVFCVIPLLGGPVVYVPLSLFLLAQGKTWQGLLLLGIGVGIVSQVDNFLRPYIIGTQSKMHYMGIFFSLLGGVLTFGPVGLMMGPVLLTVLVGLQEAIREARGFNVNSDEEVLEPA
jgi:predicted PurR-regulated permease PerM